MIRFTVAGIPAPQGSKNPWGGEANKNTRPWRVAVTYEAREAMRGRPPITGPVRLEAIFSFPRPKSHYRTGRFVDELRPDAPTFVSRTPDLDKLLRAVCDGITGAGVWRDDAQVAAVTACKWYGPAGVTIVIRSLDQEQSEIEAA